MACYGLALEVPHPFLLETRHVTAPTPRGPGKCNPALSEEVLGQLGLLNDWQIPTQSHFPSGFCPLKSAGARLLQEAPPGLLLPR